MPEASDLRLLASAGGALALMSALYWTTVAAPAHRQMRRWHERARAIPDPALRTVALTKLSEERFNVQTAPTFATLAPREQRPRAVEAIVALQVIYDYLDGLTEQPVSDPLRNGHELFHALTDAVSPCSEPHPDYYRYHPQCDDGGYLRALVASAQSALVQLPACAAITDLAGAAATRCGEAQARAHAVPRRGAGQLEGWAIEQAAGEAVSWPELLAGAASAVISIHALIAAAADRRTTPEQAARIEAFHRSTCALATILDGLADLARDERSGEVQAGYLRYFPDDDLLSAELVSIVRRATRAAPEVPHAGHHLMTLVGVVAYYTSALGAGEDASKAIVAPVRRELRPLIAPTFAFMRSWRLVKRLRDSSDRDSSLSIDEADSAALERKARDRSTGEPPAVRHLAIIRDGNRRWANARGLPSSAGHEAGADTLSARVHDALELGIKQLAVYSLSTENLSRPVQELGPLIGLLTRRIALEGPRLLRQGVRVRFIGSRHELPAELTEQMDRAQALTASNHVMTLFLAINYSARAEILSAARRYRDGREQGLRRLLYAPEMRDPELIIRTGGEQRLSNFLLWQAAYSELVFRQELWPDFTRQGLEQSLAEFDRRSRRFGRR